MCLGVRRQANLGDRELNDRGGVIMVQSRQEIVAWVGGHVLPHEGDVRAWLRRNGSSSDEVDDIVQDAYCRLAALQSVVHIQNGRAYFFQTARHIAIERLRRARIVRIDCATELEALNVVDNEPSPERVVTARRELQRVQRLIEDLPKRCRDIFILRRIRGLSQREIAARLGVSENVVEAQSARGLRLILQALAESPVAERPAHADPNDHAADRPRNRRRGRTLGGPARGS
ncbi:RNA polymerase sigma factor [Phenylobacterium sp. LjRoot225]|uniref:RNA polymerase sigma factor n=1 Tax=Phenylobacterium sp. LjRoot225 TaxID=3342285 RepID=UPI003ECD77E7